MRALLRSCNGEQYVWKKVEMKNADTFAVEGGLEVHQTGIVSISRDNRKKFVRCSICGEIIRNTPEAINAHKDRASTSETCFGCPYFRERNDKQLSAKYTLQEDGSYIVNAKKSVELICGNSWSRPDINSQKAREVCKFRDCARAEMRAIEDAFTKYPSLFDDMITVDRILENGFTERTEHASGAIHYKLKARGHITAVVNNLNIVDYFIIDYRSHQVKVMYSKKYNKLFLIRGGVYVEYVRSTYMPDSTLESIKGKIASLYN